MHRIKVNPLATEDLLEIKDHIAKELDNPTAALNVVRKIIETYERLKVFPMMGADLSAKISVKTDFRYLISGSHIVFYRTDDEFVYIYRVLYAGRDYLKFFFPMKLILSEL